jgi:peroxiredoxin Q/BCP
MKLKITQPAPIFKTTDVFGKAVDLAAYRGKKIFLEFLRNAGCAVCNLRTHQLMAQAKSLSSKNIQVLLVFESTSERMREYLTDKNYTVTFIADPQNKLYQAYKVERSFAKVMRSLANGFVTKARQGFALYEKRFSQDGHLATIPAGFVIDEDGNLEHVHYGKFVGDHFNIAEYAIDN